MYHLFAVKHNRTGQFLPSNYKGASWWEGEQEAKVPRLFQNYRAASAFVGQWVLGRISVAERLVHEDVGRKREDLSIVAMKLEIA